MGIEMENRKNGDDPNPQEYENVTLYYFWDMIYYMVVTVTTVGYGDIYPHTTEG
jgi:HJR/Mrr/RecB family endonuclease